MPKEVEDGYECKYCGNVYDEELTTENHESLCYDNPNTEHCEAKTRDGTPCRKVAMKGQNRCRHHGGATPGSPDGFPEGARKEQPFEEGNQKAAKHGLTSRPKYYFENLDEQEKGYVRAVYEGFMADAPFGGDNEGKSGIVWEIAINHHKRLHADDWLQENAYQTKTDENGNQILDEHPAHQVYDRLARTDVRRLKELGILDDPDTDKADSVGDLASAIDSVKGDEDGE